MATLGGQMLRAMLFVSISGALSLSAFAHHSRAAYDLTKEITLEGTVADLAWKNPHIYVTVATIGEDGKPNRVEVEVTSVSEAAPLGLPRDAIAPGARVTVRAHPGRGGAVSKAVGLVVTNRRRHRLSAEYRRARRDSPRRRSRPAASRDAGAPTLESFNGV